MPEKAVYSLTNAGEIEFEKLMLGIASEPINIFLDFNAVIVNLNNLSLENQKVCLSDIENNVKVLKSQIEENINSKENIPEISETAKAVLQQQFILAQAIEQWLNSIKATFEN